MRKIEKMPCPKSPVSGLQLFAYLQQDKDSFCNKMDEVLIQIYAMQNEFKDRKMKDWRELSLFLPIIIS